MSLVFSGKSAGFAQKLKPIYLTKSVQSKKVLGMVVNWI